jgi:hypothetical protein
MQSAMALRDMSATNYARTREMLDRAGTNQQGAPGRDPHAERSLVLKAVGARREQLRASPSEGAAGRNGSRGESTSQRAMREVEGFAQGINGMDRRELMNRTTALDIDDRNTSRTDPENLRGAGTDQHNDNDGLYQHWTHACGPTTAQMTRAEADPVYAMQLHQTMSDPNGPVAQEQRRILEQQRQRGEPPGSARSQAGEQALTNLDSTLGRLGAQVSPQQRRAIGRYAGGHQLTPAEQREFNTGIGRVRAADNGHPTQAELNAIRANSRRNGEGMRLEPALNQIAAGPNGHNYQPHDTSQQTISQDLGRMDTRLRNGQNVPFRVQDAQGNGHFMMISDVRGQGDNRRYLVSDPWNGRTNWVSHRDMVRGNIHGRPWRVTTFYHE